MSGALLSPVFSTPAYFNKAIYYGDVGDTLKAFTISGAKLAAAPQSQSATQFAFPGTAPSVSANGTSNAIVWAHENANPAVLHAYDAANLAHELYNSNQAAASRDHFGAGNKFITPTDCRRQGVRRNHRQCRRVWLIALMPSAFVRGGRTFDASGGHHRGLLGDHLLQPFQIRDQRGFIHHPHLADDG